MKINELEKILNISRANIRFYEKEGLIHPVRKENGYREYSENDVSLLKKIIVYRKLGISIPDIKNIFEDNMSLKEALEKSISSMGNEISRLNVSTEICEELLNKTVDNSNFDEDYYWQEIRFREAKGEEFFDISSIDTSGFDNRKKASIIIAVFSVLFFIGIAFSMICMGLSQNNNDDYYETIQNEIDTISKIDTVKIDAENDRIYVCYDEATCANVYNLDGDFLWAVSIPFAKDYRGITYFYIDNGNFIIDREDTYVYNALSGEFIEKTYAEKMGVLDKRDNWEKDHNEDEETAASLGCFFDSHNVYKADSSGKIVNYIVKKPLLYFVANENIGFVTAFISAAVLCAVTIINRFKLLKKIPLNKNEIGKTAKAFSIYLKITFSCMVVYSVFNLTLSFFNVSFLLMGIFPVTLIFILTLILSDNLFKRFNDYEQKECGMWKIYNILIYITAIICEMISMCIV